MDLMIETEEVGGAAVIAAATILAALWLCKDAILATMKPARPVRTWAVNRLRRLIRREDYMGRHRFA